MNRLVFLRFVACLIIVAAEIDNNLCGIKCCALFYRQDGMCIACPNGTQRLAEDDETTCKTCKDNFYGLGCLSVCQCTSQERYVFYRLGCLSMCQCTSQERCDNVNGCVLTRTSTKVSTTGTKRSTTESSTERKVLFRLSSDTYYGLVVGIPVAITVILITVFLFIKIMSLRRTEDHNLESVNVNNETYSSPLDVPTEPVPFVRSPHSSLGSLNSSEWSADSSHGSEIYMNDDYQDVHNVRSDNPRFILNDEYSDVQNVCSDNSRGIYSIAHSVMETKTATTDKT